VREGVLGVRPIHAILLDVGNTLLHFDCERIAGILATHGFATTAHAIRVAEYAAKGALDRVLASAARDDGAALDPVLRASYFETVLAGLGVLPAEIGPLLATLARHNRESCLWSVAEPDAATVLRELVARGFVLGVVSNADGRVEADLERAGLRPYLTAVVDSHVVGVEKPDPRIFTIALERLGVDPERAIHVGDIVGIDVRGARRAGVEPVLMDPLGCYPGSVDCPRISRLADLLDLVPRRARSS